LFGCVFQPLDIRLIVTWRNDRPLDALDRPKCGRISGGIRFADITHSMHTDRGVAGPNIPAAGELEPADRSTYRSPPRVTH
jgi:hypothetical protein